MEYAFFYGSTAFVWIILIICLIRKPLRVENVVAGIFTVGFSAVFDGVFGEYYRLYYYVNTNASILYILISSVLLYPVLNIIYTLFLPKRILKRLIYTILWIAAMFTFELTSVYFKTIVFTGWRIVPWSFITYIAAYILINIVYTYIKNRTGGRYY